MAASARGGRKNGGPRVGIPPYRLTAVGTVRAAAVRKVSQLHSPITGSDVHSLAFAELVKEPSPTAGDSRQGSSLQRSIANLMECAVRCGAASGDSRLVRSV